MGFGRLIKVTTKPAGEAPPRSVTYLVAEESSERAITIVRLGAAAPDDEVETLGRASEQLLKALRIGPGQFIRA